MLLEGLADLATSSERTLLDRTGGYVLAHARFEALLTDLLTFHILENPQLLPKEERSITTDTLTSSPGFAILEGVVEDYVRKAAYKPAGKFLEIFCKKLTIPLIGDDRLLASFARARETRNQILHVDVHHLRNLGNQPANDITTLLTMLGHIGDGVSSRFGHMTRIAAIKRIWDHLFDTPLMRPFEDFFVLDLEADQVNAVKQDARKRSISNSERIYYEIWLSHFKGEPIANFHIRSLSDDRVFWFLNTLRRTALWGNRY